MQKINTNLVNSEDGIHIMELTQEPHRELRGDKS
jgi:hypothetical protein